MNDVNAYVGCISGASLMNDYVRIALEAGLANLTIPQMSHGGELAGTLLPEDGSPDAAKLCCAASAVASIKLHGRKP